MAEPKGIVFLVGAGPGDPGLITVRGLACLREAEVVVYDYLVNPSLLGEIPPASERIYVGKKAGAHTLGQEEINALLVERCKQGRRVVRLKGGDPFVFGRGGEEALALSTAGCAFEVVPGVTSGIAAAAYAGIPVTHRGLAATLTFVTGHEDPSKEESDIDWVSLGAISGTLVFYMGVRNLPLIAERLIGAGRAPSTPVALIAWGTYPRQRTLIGTLGDIAAKADAADLKPPAMIVVGEVASLREQLNWFERRPLFGRRIVVTRSRAQAGELSRRLEELGAEAIEFPVIRIVPPGDPAPLREAAERIESYDWTIFTSVNGVDAFFDILTEQNLDARALHDVKVCAIGPATRQSLEARGIRAELMPEKYVAESVAQALAAEQGGVGGKRILLPRADIARGFLREALEAMGAKVDEVEAYRTVLEVPEGAKEIQSDLAGGRIDAITFTSSSTARNFASLIGEEAVRSLPPGVQVVSIGPETTKTLEKCTDHPIHQAAEYTMDGIVEMLKKLFASNA